jgi:hypothetical protein
MCWSVWILRMCWIETFCMRIWSWRSQTVRCCGNTIERQWKICKTILKYSLNLSGNSINILHSLKYSPSFLESQSWGIHRCLQFTYFKQRLLSINKVSPSHQRTHNSCTVHITYNKPTRTGSPFIARSLDIHVGLKVATRLTMYAQTNVGLLCCVVLCSCRFWLQCSRTLIGVIAMLVFPVCRYVVIDI